jgi:ATP-dependent Clp protease protease subunit
VNTFAKARAIAQKFRADAGNTRRYPSQVSPGALFARVLQDGVGLPDREKWPQNKAELTGELFIYEQIGFDCWTGEGVTGKGVADALAAMKGVKKLNVFINSEGGDVFEAKTIYTQLKRFDAEKVVHIDGIAASAATFIAMAGDKIITSPVATWMVHEAWTGAMGRSQDMRAIADLLDLENQTIAETYAARTGKTAEEMKALMSAPPDGTWMNAATALEHGFTDEIGEAADPAEETTNTARSKVAGALAMTQARLTSMSAGQLLAAKAEMRRRDHPVGQPPGAKPASR